MNKNHSIMELQIKLEKFVEAYREVFDAYGTIIKVNTFRDELFTEERNGVECIIPYRFKATITEINTYEKVEVITFSLNSIYTMSKKYGEEPSKTLEKIFYQLILCLTENVHSPNLAVKL